MPRNKDHLKAYRKSYRISHKEEIKAKRKSYHESNKKKENLRVKIWRDKNKERIKQYHIDQREHYNELNRKRRKEDLQYRLKTILRSRLRKFLDRKSKSKSTIALLGCDIPTLIQYLEGLFKEGMTWENHGLYGWHIDHIIPCDLFDLTKPEEQARCFHYTNLQPLWAEDNLRKSNHLI